MREGKHAHECTRTHTCANTCAHGLAIDLNEIKTVKIDAMRVCVCVFCVCVYFFFPDDFAQFRARVCVCMIFTCELVNECVCVCVCVCAG